MLDRYATWAGIVLPVLKDYPGFTDEADIADYAKEAVKRFFKAGIINGYLDGSFRPRAEATRAEVATMLMRFLEAIVP